MGVTAYAGSGVSLTLGAVWQMVVRVDDAYGQLAADTLTVTVTPPDGVPVLATVEQASRGLHLASYVTADAGVHVALAETLTHGSTAFSANVTPVTPASDRPDRAALAGYLSSIGTLSWSDSELDDVLAAETSAQWDVCAVPAAYPFSLREALLRRCARNLALRALPLAVLRGDADGGDNTVLPANDPEVRRLERPWRKLRIG